MINATKSIGITGNIATGKSIVRRMLANFGALEIDADVIAHRMLYPVGPAYQSVINMFGKKILADNGHISHSKLGEIVFNNPDKLRQLESIIHPWVSEAILRRVQASKHAMVAIEAIKLLEAGLGDLCETIWVSHASTSHQLERLVQTRNMSEPSARNRIEGQPPQSEKLAQADVVINTEGTYRQTWQQIQKALNDTIQIATDITTSHITATESWQIASSGRLATKTLQSFWQAHSGQDPTTIYEHLGKKILMPIIQEGQLLAIIILDIWNFAATINHVYPTGILNNFPNEVLEAFQTYSKLSQCEILFIPEEIIKEEDLKPFKFGYDFQFTDKLPYPAWKRAGDKRLSGQNERIWTKIIGQPLEIKDTLFSDRAIIV